jgi:hydroxymethylglutaryl-CoA synthase
MPACAPSPPALVAAVTQPGPAPAATAVPDGNSPVFSDCGGNETPDSSSGFAPRKPASTTATGTGTAIHTSGATPTTPPINEEPLGILAIQTAIPPYKISAQLIEENYPDQACKTRFKQSSIGAWDVDEDAISLAMTALRRLLATMTMDDIRNVGRLEVGTESNVDVAKSIKSYLTEMFEENLLEEILSGGKKAVATENSPSQFGPVPIANLVCKELLGVDNINACYGGTAALLNTLDWLRANPDTAKLGIVVVTDTAEMGESELAFQGAGAVAMLVGGGRSLSLAGILNQ